NLWRVDDLFMLTFKVQHDSVSCTHGASSLYDEWNNKLSFEIAKSDPTGRFSASRDVNWICWSEDISLRSAQIECTRQCQTSCIWIDLFTCSLNIVPLVYDDKSYTKTMEFSQRNKSATTRLSVFVCG